MVDAAAVMARLAKLEIEWLRVAFVDYNGIARARALAARSVPAALAQGVNFSSPTVDFTSAETFPPDAAFDPSSPDLFARPDPSTLRLLPVPRSGIVLADLIDADGREWPGCPRAALRRVVARAAERGLRFTVGFEPEGYVVRGEAAAPQPAGATGFATLDGLDALPAFMEELLAALGAAGLTVDQWSEEYGPGQIEINLHQADPLEAADGLVLFKYLFRAVARRHGLIGTFMPKPFGDRAGSGLHVHLSASPVGGEAALFSDPSHGAVGLSPLGLHTLSGLLAHGEALMAVGAGTVNSYKRFVPGSWAPTSIMYAPASRAAFVRIPDSSGPRRLELRVGDGAGNPYLYTAAILAAALDGIEREIDSGPPVPGDVSVMPPATRAALGARPLPRTLGEALDCLERDTAVCDALGPLIAAEYLKIKRAEWEAFCLHVGPWDREWYLERY